ncbi:MULTISPECIES: 3-oxoadipyl-CoA thiolase [unclassified Novosphingobium]|uniref:3-oxoadipyl-CoA thiolase n=1 Tax=unclassified Novosphingobium TaxID=2644732 RepID=UPI0014948CE6|nr:MULTISPECIES: 3-oxoadipyl-CoA thiolase [unclassified Novosphingobium]MBB3360502.1 3-oxoadipyl-CoA thiolase [Novosphingobium sp. BK256]MBB3376884.1 3-oxoadipyl-CoA thiolase [Novosphingobium sp. BK280]MBB3381242.1 3-oxoadipyl-CoA thiolase [Novosphingobium sp. BK258]MBB3422946.1 3-oxoadipyl-CoA thiolase [Novosphingobium sp. BK267]MBB3451648.1 3-oxoadipyl-CoA thiolase [Novosphingobium sp. BK352]
MRHAFICDAIRTPIGRLNGALSTIRADDLAAIPLRALGERNGGVDWEAIDDVLLGCANQAGEDNRNVARMAVLLAGLPEAVPGATVNRLCGSGLNAVGMAAQAIRAGDAELIIAGGVESMTRAPFVLGKAATPFDRGQKIEDTTLGWRFINPLLRAAYGVDTMPQTGENVADEWQITREEQDAFALASQDRAAAAIVSGRMAVEIVPVGIPQPKGEPTIFARDEHPRATSLEALAKLRPVVRPDGTVTAGNASGLNDGAAAMLVASEAAARTHGLTPRARILGMAATGIAPRVMGAGPIEAARKLCRITGIGLEQIDVIELNEAFASQAVATLRSLGIRADDPRVNRNGGAIALGHPLGMSGARIVMTAIEELHHSGGRYALAFMCVGVGQGIALMLEKV